MNFKTMLRESVKIPLWRWGWRNLGARRGYRLLRARSLLSLRGETLDAMRFAQSVSNAGFVALDAGYVAVATNQSQSFGHERFRGRGFVPDAGCDAKSLYRIDIDDGFCVREVRELRAFVDGACLSTDAGLGDARLFRFRGETWLICSVAGNTRESWPHVGRLNGDRVDLRRPHIDRPPPQKNWMPFVVDDRLYIEYSVDPHEVLELDVDGMQAQPYARTDVCGASPHALHGGAPAVRLDQDRFLGLANSQQLFWYQARYYGCAFYTFSARPPFGLLAITPPVRIGGLAARIHYTVGMHLDTLSGRLVVSYGLDDFEGILAELDLDRLLELLEPIGTGVLD